jgi:hypothetical protein
MYAKITDGLVEQFPYSVSKLKRDNPNTSYPKNMSADQFANAGVFPVIGRSAPDTGPYESAYHTGNVILVDAEWQREWSVRDMFSDTTDEDNVTTTKAEHEAAYQTTLDETAATSVRLKRTGLLADTDWTQLADAPTDAAPWATYRQALRDITDHVNFPYVSDEDWPVKP